MKRLFKLTALGFLLAVFCIVAAPAWADVDQRIQALEDELARLKAEQTAVKTEQIEMRKEAAAATAALPTFSYRPANGVTIEAADKSWSLNFGMEVHFRMDFNHGRDEAGRTNGEIMGRRFRTQWTYCLNNCFWEIQTRLDLDGFATSSGLQRGVGWIHLEQVSPWLPTVYLGMDAPSEISTYRQTSSLTAAQADYDLLSRNNGFNTGRMGNGVGFNWDDKDLSGVGIPGRLRRINIARGNIGEGDDGRSSFTDRRNYVGYMNVEPFSKLDSKWLKGWGFEVGGWSCYVDPLAADSACNRLRIRDHGDGGRQNLFDTGPATPIGRGITYFLMPGAQWQIGPVNLRGVAGFQRYPSDRFHGAQTIGKGQKSANMWLAAADIYLWSPKGFMTGNSNTVGSLLFGTHFERTDVICKGCTDVSGEFSKQRILLREWDLWYFFAPRASFGVNVLWYDAARLTTDVQKNLGCSGAGTVPGRGCDWIDVMLNLRWSF